MSLSTHVLDGARGTPAAGVPVRWERLVDDDWTLAEEAVTDADGRVGSWAAARTEEGTHRLVFGTGDYFAGRGVPTFYPEVTVVFAVTRAEDHHHVPLLLSPFAYSTYRGS
jgi:5-hydroxyisourate hydrolase